MDDEIQKLPNEVPVMTLKDTILFPRAMIPLFIFEDRYKKMLSDLLIGPRIIAIGTLNEDMEKELTGEEPPYSVAGLGIVRACHRHQDGSAHMIVQGLCRVNLVGSTSILPYRQERIELLKDVKSDKLDESVTLTQRKTILNLIREKEELGGKIPDGTLGFLDKITEVDAFIDLSVYTTCASIQDKQKILSTPVIQERYSLFADILRTENIRLKIFKKMQGKIDSEDIENN